MKKIIGICLALVAGAGVRAQTSGGATASIAIDRSVTHQQIWGFGGAIGISTGGVNNFDKLSQQTQNKMLDRMFLNNGDNLGYTMIRMPIKPGFSPGEGVYKWNPDDEQAQLALAIQKRFPALTVEACPWSPPFYMKENKQEIGGAFLPQYGQQLAEYLYQWSETFRSYGVNIKYIAIQNEPGGGAKWTSCRYTPEILDDVTSLTWDYFRSKHSPVMIGGPEGAGAPGTRDKYLAAMVKSRDKMDFISTHYYHKTSGIVDFSEFHKPVIMTEVCDGKNPNDPSIKDGVKWAEQINITLNYNGNGYMYWWIASDTGTNKSLLTFDAKDDSYFINKRGYVMGQFSRFMRPGDVRVDAASSDSDLLVTATKNPATGITSMVVTNKSANDITATITGLSGKSLSGRLTSDTQSFAPIAPVKSSGGVFTFVFPAMSVTSLSEK